MAKDTAATPKPDAPKQAPGTDSGGKCVAVKCKHDSKRFGFCEEHYDHFKFGLIKKNGEMVSDYEKKFGHFQDWKEKQARPRKTA